MSGELVERYWHLGRYRYVYYRNVLEQYCRRVMREGVLVLDVGCGAKISSLSDVSETIQVVGVDVSQRNVVRSHRQKKLKGYYNFSYLRASIIFLPFREYMFGMVVCADVLEHIKDNRKAVKEVSRVCRLAGYFVGSTSNLLNPVMLFDSYGPKRIVHFLVARFAGEHYERNTRFAFNKLIETLRHNGFQVEDIKLVGFPLFYAGKYQCFNKRLPWYAYIWIIFDRLTEKKPLNLLKEIMVFYTKKIL